MNARIMKTNEIFMYMEQLKFYPKLILRSPSRSIEEYASASLDQLLADHDFKQALKHANPMFFGLLSKKAFDVSKLNDQEISTLKKYLNRMCFRPTPFGLFSSFSVLSWHKVKQPVVFSKRQQHVHALPDQIVNHLLNSLLKENTDPSKLYYRSNVSCYIIHQEIRYLQTCIVKGTVEYQLQSVPANYVNRKILKFCYRGRSLEEIIRFLQEQVSCDFEEAEQYCQFLIENGMLVSSFFFNVTGTPYLSRFMDKIGKHTPLYDVLLGLDEKLKLSDLDGAGNAVKTLLANNGFSGSEEKAPLYINSERKLMPGDGLSSLIQPLLVDAIDCCKRLSLPASVPDMTQFIRLFKDRYDLQQVPLLHVLDPEAGIGYGNTNYEVLLLKDLTFKDQAESPGNKWSEVHILLLKLWNEGRVTKEGVPLIKIDEEALSVLPVSEDVALPPSSSVIFRLTGENVFIESAGGATATQLAGRFTLFNEELLKAMREIARTEERLNPDVVFAEIIHLTGAHTDNINLRENIYDFDLIVSGQSVLPPEKQILLNDLLVSVRNNRVILYSRQLDKVIVPRLSSAYNYRLNDLPVFRFLCDVQNQGIKSGLSFDLSTLFPGLDFYPRVMYKNSILYPATWRLKDPVIKKISSASPGNQIQLFNEFADKISLTENFSVSQGDRYLVFNRKSESDIHFFIKTIANKEEVILKEFFTPDSSFFSLRDEQDKSYGHQFICFLVNEKPVYNGRLVNYAHAIKKQRLFLPGSEWLYIKIYCKPITANHLLSHVLMPLIQKKQHAISKWFFIRYNDPHPHIRLRLKISDADPTNIISFVSDKLEREIHSGIIASYVVDVYQRELERYGPAIDLVEDVFHEGSLLVTSLLRGLPDFEKTETEYSVTFVSLLSLFKSLGSDFSFNINLFEVYYSGLFAEFKGNKLLKVQLDQKYRIFKKDLERWERVGEQEIYSFSARKHQRNFNKAVRLLLHSIPEKEYRRYLSDMVHMQINRILTDEHRKQELVISYCLFKHYTSMSRRQYQEI